MVDFDTFEENGMVYAVNEGLKDGKRVPTMMLKKETHSDIHTHGQRIQIKKMKSK